MKKQSIIALFIVTVLIASFIPVNINASPSVYAGFSSSSLQEGQLQAYVIVNSPLTEDIFVSLGYYTSSNILTSNVSAVLSSTGQHSLTLNIPSSVAFGDYAKIVLMNKISMEPISFQGNPVVYCTEGNISNINTSYTGQSERYYTIDSPSGSLSVSGRTVSLSARGSQFRLKDMTQGYFAFEDKTQPRYRLEYTLDNGIRVYFYSAGSSKQRWLIKEYGSGISIYNTDSGYLSVDNNTLAMSAAPYEWQLTYCGETFFSAITSLPGFKSLPLSQQERIIQICTSVGADALPYAPNNKSFLDDCENSFKSIYMQRNSLSPQQQQEGIISAVSKYPTGALAESNVYYPLSSFPGGDASVTQAVPIKTKHVMWDLVEENGVIYSADEFHPYTGDPVNCYLIKVTYKTATDTHTVNVYCIDPEYENVSTAISALGKLPHNYRKFIKNMYVYHSTTTSTYNCGPEELFVRLGGIANETAMIKSFAHELGHCLDYNANSNPYTESTHICQSPAWQDAVNADIITVSEYGNCNLYEGFAEFARLYFLCCGNRDLEIGIKQLYPNRYEVFTQALKQTGAFIY